VGLYLLVMHLVKCSGSPYLWGIYSKTLKWMPESLDSAKLYISCYFPMHTYKSMIKFNYRLGTERG
jgi:hypothetical protein